VSHSRLQQYPDNFKKSWFRFQEMAAVKFDFVHFVMPARSAGITKWTKSAFQVKSARKADFVSLPKQEWEHLISCLAAAV
jgi:hypothetical protein